jgi:hypothetical protein
MSTTSSKSRALPGDRPSCESSELCSSQCGAILMYQSTLTQAPTSPRQDRIWLTEHLRQPLRIPIQSQPSVEMWKKLFSEVRISQLQLHRALNPTTSRETHPFSTISTQTDRLMQHGAKDVVTIFHKPSVPASTRVLTFLKQANANAKESATEDQASNHAPPAQAERHEFDLDVQEGPPTGDQLKSLLDYIGGHNAGKLIVGARDTSDALAKLKEDAELFQRPVVSLY